VIYACPTHHINSNTPKLDVSIRDSNSIRLYKIFRHPEIAGPTDIHEIPWFFPWFLDVDVLPRTLGPRGPLTTTTLGFLETQLPQMPQ